MITPQTGDLRSPGISTNYSMGESSKHLYQLGMGETKGAGPTNGCWFSRFYTNNFDPFPTASGFLPIPMVLQWGCSLRRRKNQHLNKMKPNKPPPPKKWVVEPIPGRFTARWLWVSNKDWDWDDSSGSTKGFRSLWVSSPKGSPQLWQVRAMWKRPIPRPLNHKHPSEKALVVKGKPKHRVFLSSWNTSSTTESTNRARDLNCCKIYRLSKYSAIHFPFPIFPWTVVIQKLRG